MNEIFCKFRFGVECGLYGEACKNCGWNPLVEADRIHNIMTGKVKSYLKINTVNAACQKNYRERENEKSV